MTVRRAIATVVGCTLLLAAIGAGAGFSLGRFVPEYYRNVFRDGRQPGFDPVSVGIGQGLTQGIAGGVVVGLVVVALLCWRETRLQRMIRPLNESDGQSTTSGSTARWLLLIIGAVLALGFCLACGVLIGGAAGEVAMLHRHCDEQRRAVSKILASDPAFSEVTVDDFCDGDRIILTGHVKTKSDLSRLREQVTRAIGKQRADYAIGGVQVP